LPVALSDRLGHVLANGVMTWCVVIAEPSGPNVACAAIFRCESTDAVAAAATTIPCTNASAVTTRSSRSTAGRRQQRAEALELGESHALTVAPALAPVAAPGAQRLR
jgi:hypothetical protein